MVPFIFVTSPFSGMYYNSDMLVTVFGMQKFRKQPYRRDDANGPFVPLQEDSCNPSIIPRLKFLVIFCLMSSDSFGEFIRIGQDPRYIEEIAKLFVR